LFSLHTAKVYEGGGIPKGGRSQQVSEIEAFRLIIGSSAPDWIWIAMQDGWLLPGEANPPTNNWARRGIIVNTTEGQFPAYPGDWILKYSNDEILPCKAANFEGTYEVEEVKRVF
jgi:hypothetical protein